MSIPAKVLLVLIGLRLLLPPGLCVCKLSAPASRLLVHVLGGDPPPVLPDDDDHHAGCPASAVALGLGATPTSPAVDDASDNLPVPSLPPPAPPFSNRDPAFAPHFHVAAPPLYVCHCAFLF